MENPRMKLLFNCVLLILILSLMTVFGAPSALAQNGSRIYLNPIVSSADSVTVAVVAENVADLYGAEFRLRYDPTMLSVQDAQADQAGIQIEVGSLLPGAKGFVVANQVDETKGTITFAMTLLNPAPAVTGSGPLAVVRFGLLQNGPIKIEVEQAKLVAINLQTIPTEISGLTLGQSEIQVAAEAGMPATAAGIASPQTVAATDFPWWMVAAAIMLAGTVGLGIFVMMSGFNTPDQPAETSPVTYHQSPYSQAQPYPYPAKPRPRHTVGTRPSAFK